MFVVGGELFESLHGGGEGGEGRRGRETEGVDCGCWGDVEVGVDADGVGEGERGEGFEVGDDEGGDVGELDRVLFEDLGWRS